MTKIYVDAGERIFLVRSMRGYTREYLAEKANISSKFLYEIETGKKGFSADVLYHICVALDVNCDYIITGKEEYTFDAKLAATLQLFDKNQTENLSIILRAIYEINNVLNQNN